MMAPINTHYQQFIEDQASLQDPIELTENLSHKWEPPKEKSTGQIDAAFLHLPASTGCK